jgi:hypothetical protein
MWVWCGNCEYKVKGKNKRAQITLNLTNKGGFFTTQTMVDGKQDFSLDKKISW